MTGIKERFDNLYNYPVGEEPGTDYSGASDLYTGGMNNKSVTGYLLAGGLALAGQGINYLANRETNQANREMQAEANRQNVDLWRMQTEYNTPANQIARLRQANLNPNLIYGNPTNTAGSAPEMKSSKNERYQLDPMTMANVMLMSKQMQNLEADNEVKRAEARNINADAIAQENDNAKFEDRYNREVEKFNIDKEAQDIVNSVNRSLENLNSKEFEFLGRQLEEFNKNAPYILEQNKLEVKAEEERIKMSQSQRAINFRNLKLLDIAIQEAEEEFKLMYGPVFAVDGKGGGYITSHRFLQVSQDVNIGESVAVQEKVKAVLARCEQYLNDVNWDRIVDRSRFESFLRTSWVGYVTDSFGYYLGDEGKKTLTNVLSAMITKRLPK